MEAHLALDGEPVRSELLAPIRVRMALHTGEAQMRNEANYVAQAIIRTARLRAIAHGGQILVSQAARDYPSGCFREARRERRRLHRQGHLVTVEARISSGRYTNDARRDRLHPRPRRPWVTFPAKPRTATTTPDAVDTDDTEGENEAA